GVIVCQGGNMAGWALWLDDGIPRFIYNCFGHDLTVIEGPALMPGDHTLRVDFVYDGGFGRGGDLMISVNGDGAGAARLERTVPLVFSMSGETFDVGTDTGAPVGPYPHDYRCTAEIIDVTLERLNEPSPDVVRQVAEGMWRAGLSTQ
ncbi:MAG: arylsulfatase, partial [Ilumatobacteraceae bacterium]